MRAAAQRAMAAYQAVTRKAERLSEEMDEVTPAHGIVTAELGPDDSVVTSIAAVIDSHQHKKTG